MSTATERESCAPFEIKSFDLEAREFSGLASTWDVDLEGERFEKGAFARTIKHWRDSQKSATPRIIPMIDSHDHYNARSVFGKVVDMEETPKGLMIKARIVASGDGDEYLARIQGGYLNGLSVGFDTVSDKVEERETGGVKQRIRVITEARLLEVSAVQWGANPYALIGAKSLLKEATGRMSVKHFRDKLAEMLDDEVEVKETPPSEIPVDDPPAPEPPAGPVEEPAEDKPAVPEETEAPEPSPMEAAVAEMEKGLDDLEEQKAAAVEAEDYFAAEDLKGKIEALQKKIRRQKKLIEEVKRTPIDEWSVASKARRKREAALAMLLAEEGELVTTA